MKARWTLPLLTLLIALPASATVSRALSLEEMTRQAELIVHATVEQQTVTWSQDRKMIHTLTEVRVIDPLKGPTKADERLVIRQLGGDLGDEAILVSGNASMTPGEEVVLFLDRDDRAPLHYVVGMAQGKYAVDRAEGTPRVTRQLDGLTFIEDTPRAEVQKLAPTPRDKKPTTTSLDEFKDQLRAFMR